MPLDRLRNAEQNAVHDLHAILICRNFKVAKRRKPHTTQTFRQCDLGQRAGFKHTLLQFDDAFLEHDPFQPAAAAERIFFDRSDTSRDRYVVQVITIVKCGFSDSCYAGGYLHAFDKIIIRKNARERMHIVRDHQLATIVRIGLDDSVLDFEAV